MHAQIAQLMSEKAALAALVPKLEARLDAEQKAERERSDAAIGRAEAHAAEATRQREQAAVESAKAREEASAAAAAAREQRLSDKVQSMQVELATWPARLEAAEGRLPPLQAKADAALSERYALEPQLERVLLACSQCRLGTMRCKLHWKHR